MNKVHHVFISSTYSDLIDERKKVSEAIGKAGYVPEGMEIFPASSQKSFDFIKRIIDRCDYYILVIGGRYGSLIDGIKSYTRAEFEYAQSKNIPTLALLRRSDSFSALDEFQREQDPELSRRLSEFREFVETSSLVDYWSTPDEAGMKAIAALSQEVISRPGIGWIRGDSAASSELLKELNELRKENEELRQIIDQDAIRSSFLSESINVAGLEDTFEFSVKLYHSRFTDKTIPTAMTWKEILAVVGPEYRTASNSYGVQRAFERYFTKSHGDYKLRYDKDLFESILMQFEVLGLMVAQVYSIKTGGKALFHVLTPLGVKTFLDARVIRKV